MSRALTRSLVILPVLALALTACEQAQQEPTAEQEPLVRPAKIVPLTVNGASLKRTYPGTLEALQEAELAFRVSGQLMELPATSGGRVKQGDLLAKVDPTDFKNTVAERQARFELAQSQVERARVLLEKNLSSQTAFDQANAELKSARAALQQAKDNLRYTELKAPFDGLIARVDIENFQPVQAQKPIISLRSDDQLLIRFSLPETIIAQLRRIEDPAVIDQICGEVRFTTHPNKSFRACHHKHESVPDPLTRNYTGWAVLDPITEFAALPGMSATMSLDLSPYLAEQNGHGVFAPVEAVFSEGAKQWVWAVGADMKAQRLEVIVGRIEGELIEITSDIDRDTRVIAAGVSFVREGMQVKPIVKQRGL
jgi:RND family efflux transporter MFP subunit